MTDKTQETITVSHINLCLLGFPKTLEQVTNFEAKKRGLVPDGPPRIFRRENGSFDERAPFEIKGDDFKTEREGQYNVVIPDDAVAYVVGEDSGAVNAHIEDYRAREVYIPVQFYRL